MKKSFVLVSVLLVGCSFSSATKQLLQEQLVDTMDMPCFSGDISTAISENAFYYLDSIGGLHAYDKNDNIMDLQTLNYIDGKKQTNTNAEASMEKYGDDAKGGFCLFGGKIIYSSVYRNMEGETSYRINLCDIDGQNTKVFAEVDYQPWLIVGQKDKIAVVSAGDQNNSIYFYDLTGKEVKCIPSFEVYGISVDRGRFITTSSTATYEIPVDTLEPHKISEDGQNIPNHYELFCSDNKIAYYESETDNENTMITSGIKDLAADKVIFTVDGAVIQCFDDSYVYTATVGGEHTHYQVLDWNGNVIHDITPFDSLGEPVQPAMLAMRNCDYGNIISVWNNQIFGETYNLHAEPFVCDFESGNCKLLFRK